MNLSDDSTHGQQANDLFPIFSDEEVSERVNRMWDLSNKVPFPKFKMRCSVCGSDEILYKHAKIHNNPKQFGSKSPYRADCSFKCTNCSNVWVHGVKIPESMFRVGVYNWRELRNMKGGD